MKHKFYSYYLDTPIKLDRVFDVFEADEDAPARDQAIFFVHGGGWNQGSRIGQHVLMDEFARRGYTCASTDYRLKGVDAFAQISDVREAFDVFVGMLMDKGIKNPKVVIYGSSAGAHLASLCAFALPGELGEDISRLKHPEIRPCKLVVQATPYDFLEYEGIMPQFWSLMQSVAGKPYAEDPERYERLSLKNYVREDNPPAFFIEAEYEHLFDSRLTHKIAVRHREMNIGTQWKVYERVEHGFFYELKRKMQLEAFEDFCLFLENKLETPF